MHVDNTDTNLRTSGQRSYQGQVGVRRGQLDIDQLVEFCFGVQMIVLLHRGQHRYETNTINTTVT